MNCLVLYADNGVPPEASSAEKANVAFTSYWNDVKLAQGDRGCCFGDSDGLSNCRAEITCGGGDTAPTSPTPPTPPPPTAVPVGGTIVVESETVDGSELPPNSSVVIRKGATLTVTSPIFQATQIEVFGRLIIHSNTHTIVNRIEVQQSGELNIGPDATNVTIELIHADCTSEEIFSDDTAGVRNSECLRSGQLISHGRTSIHGAPVKSWTLLSANANSGDTSILVEDCTGWAAGNEFVLAYGRGQSYSTKRKIASIEVAGGSCRVHMTEPLFQVAHAFSGFGDGDPVYPEVLYLHRNVLITGLMHNLNAEPRDRQGIVVSQRFTGSFELHNAKVENCGRIFLGEYCVHLHLMNACPSCKIEGNAVIDGISKGITVHGTHGATVHDNVVLDVFGVGIYVENGMEYGNTISANVVGCSSIGGCVCRNCVASQAFGDDPRQAAMYFKSPRQDFIGNHAFGALSCLLYEGSNVRTPCTINLPFGRTENNVFHCQQFGWYPTDAFPRNVVQSPNGLVEDTSTCSAFYDDGRSNAAEAVILNHTEYDIRDFGVASYVSFPLS